MSLHRLLQELHCLCAHLAVLPVCRSASLPRVPLCCHVWKQASALMYNTSLDPCFWYGCWQDRVEEKLVPKRCSLWDNVSYWATKRLVLHFTCEMVSESAYLCYFWFLEKTTTDKNASHSFNVICLYGWAQQLLCKNLRLTLIGREVLDSYKELSCGNVIGLHVVGIAHFSLQFQGYSNVSYQLKCV